MSPMPSRVAEFLSGHPRVAWVSYAGLKEKPVPRSRSEIFAERRWRRLHLCVEGGYEPGPGSSKTSSCSRTSPISRHPQPHSPPRSTTHRQLTTSSAQAAGGRPPT